MAILPTSITVEDFKKKSYWKNILENDHVKIITSFPALKFHVQLNIFGEFHLLTSASLKMLSHPLVTHVIQFDLVSFEIFFFENLP